MQNGFRCGRVWGRYAHGVPLPLAHPFMTTNRPPLLLRDMREGPGHQMGTISLRIPAELLDALGQCAGKLRTSRAVLCRNLLAQGLEQLEDH